MATTPIYAWRHQGLADPPNGAILGENLALDIEATVSGIQVGVPGNFNVAGNLTVGVDVTVTDDLTVGDVLTIAGINQGRGKVVGINAYTGAALIASSTATEVAVPSATWNVESTYALPTGRLYKAELTVSGSPTAATNSATAIRIRKGAETIVGTQLCFWWLDLTTNAFSTSGTSSLFGYFKNTSGSTVNTKLSVTNHRWSGAATTAIYGDTSVPILLNIYDVGSTTDHSDLATLVNSV